MSINVVLKSSRATYYANGIAEFTTNFSNFFPEDESYCEYDLGFSFITESNNTLTADDLYGLELDVGTNMQIIGTTNANISSNAGTDNTIGYIRSDYNHNDFRLRSDFMDNPLVCCKGRPSSNHVKVIIRDLQEVIAQKNPPFLLILRFQKREYK
jgi:hypothetical protein